MVLILKMLLTIISLVCFVIISLSLYYRFCYWGKLFAKIPGPRAWPLIGNALELLILNQETAFQFLGSLYTKYGPVSRIQAFNLRGVTIFDPEDIEKLYSTTRFNTKETPYYFLKSWLCDGLLISNGDKWKQRRKLLTPTFHFNILKNFCKTFNEQTEKFLEMIEKEEDKNTDIWKFISITTLNVMCETSMGTSVNESQSGLSKYFTAIHRLGTITATRLVKVAYHVNWIYNISPLARIEKNLLKDLHGFSTKIIQKRKACMEKSNLISIDGSDVYGKKDRYAMLDLLLKNEKEGQIDMNGIREEVDTFMFEGHDTTATALCFMIMRIANEPKAQDLIYEEMQHLFGDSTRSPTTEDLNNMKYLDCCIKESLRLYPSVHYMSRLLTEDVKLGGYLVPSGTFVQIPSYFIHHRADLYPDPEKFIPERFLPHNTFGRHPYSYIPFSAGPRNCIGKKFAMLEMKTLMSGLIRRFRLEPVTRPEDIVFLADIILRPKYPLLVRVRPRKVEKI